MKALLVLLAGCTAAASSEAADAKGFFLPTGAVADNTAAPVIRVDARGTTHAVYPAFVGGGAYYAVVGSDAASTKVVHFTTDGTVTNAMLALTADGHPRVLLSAYQHAYFASCDAACGEQASWTIGAIATKGIDQDITGDALALDPAGHPRFLMHTHVAYLGIGQKDPQTSWWACDAQCTSANSWTNHVLTADLWQGSTLRFDAAGTAKLATITGNFTDQITYYECAGACDSLASWHGTLLGKAFESTGDVVTIHPRASLALTKAGAPRIVVLARANDGSRGLGYLACDHDCTTGSWSATVISKNEKLDSGYELALDGADRPHVAYTLDYNVALATGDGGTFTTKLAAASTALPADQIFLNYNCTVGGWLFHDPSIAITADGHTRLGFQARDASVAGSTTDHTHGSCVAGTDMTWSRFASL